MHNDAYTFDLGANFTTKQLDSAQTVTTSSALNQLSGVSFGGVSQAVPFTGTVSGSATLTVSGTSTPVVSGTFSATLNLLSGSTYTIPLVASDAHGNQKTSKYQYSVPLVSVTAPTYDADGNELTNGTGQSYTWDAKNELVSISQGGNTYAFGYDALGRRISETDNGTLVKQWVWDGTRMAEERNGSNGVTKRFYSLGEQITVSGTATSYYYTRDHLGSVREMTDSSGTIQARYDYDPSGRVTAITNTVPTDFQYAGMYIHQPSGLNLTRGGHGKSNGRPYDPNMARFPSRDPMGEAGGINLYVYVLNDPINNVDPFGLDTYGWGITGGGSFGGGGSFSGQLTFSNSTTGSWMDTRFGATGNLSVMTSTGATASLGFVDTTSGANSNTAWNGKSGAIGASGNIWGPVVFGYDRGNLSHLNDHPSTCDQTNNFFLGLGARFSPDIPDPLAEVHISGGKSWGGDFSLRDIGWALYSLSLGD